MANSDLLLNPNKHAARVWYTNFMWYAIYISWYQQYIYIPRLQKALPYNRLLSRKSDILKKVYEWINIYEKIDSVLDIGSNNGYFLLQARYYGVTQLQWVDIDPAVQKLYNKWYMRDVRFDLMDYQSIQKSYDLTIALSLTHRMVWQLADQKWADKKQSLEKMFSKLAETTNYLAVIELVTSDDEVIIKFNHHEFTITIQDYLDVAEQYFWTIKYLWSTRFSRHIYAFYKNKK